MKKLFYIITLVFSVLSFAQSIKMDTLIGNNGIFKRYIPKEISPNQNLHFNLKIKFSGSTKNGKPVQGEILMNTKNGYFGLLKSGTGNFEANSKNFNLLVYSAFLKNYHFSTDKKGNKMVMSLPIDGKMEQQEAEIKNGNSPAKTFTSHQIKAFPYNNLQSPLVNFYFSEANLSGKLKSVKRIMYSGLGFIEINGKTVICMQMENGESEFHVDSIEKVAYNLDTSEFKKNKEMDGVQNQIQDLMKKYKK